MAELKANNQVGAVILIFITVIIGATLITALGNTIFEAANPQTTTNQSVDVSSARTAIAPNISAGGSNEGQFANNVEILLGNTDLQSFSALRMVNGTTFTQNTDYRVNLSEGGLTMLNSSKTRDFQSSNITLADYTHNTDKKYIEGSTVSRTIVNNLVIIFIITGLVIWIYAYVKKTWLDQIGQ